MNVQGGGKWAGQAKYTVGSAPQVVPLPGGVGSLVIGAAVEGRPWRVRILYPVGGMLLTVEQPWEPPSVGSGGVAGWVPWVNAYMRYARAPGVAYKGAFAESLYDALGAAPGPRDGPGDLLERVLDAISA